MEMPQNMKMLSREEHTAQHKGTLTVERISDEKLNAMINNASYSIDWNKEKHQDTTDHEQQYSILKELKECREADKKTLTIKQQLQLVRDKCPDIWQYVRNNACTKEIGIVKNGTCSRNSCDACDRCYSEALKEGED